MAVQILEQHEKYPGVSAEEQAVRNYPLPGGANAAHLLGYLRPVTLADLKKEHARDIQIQGSDLIGATGLEGSYDAYLRGQSGLHVVSVDAGGGVTGTLSESPPTPGDNLVTSLDAGVQRVLEQSLANAMKNARGITEKQTGLHYRGDSAAGVVIDVRTGHVVAMASLPTYNPNVWVGGISQKELDQLGNAKAGQPILDRATFGEFAPGSTFKLVTTAAVVHEGRGSFNGTYFCPGSLKVGNSTKHNFEGEFGGHISLHQTIVQSCDTVYYQFAIDDWFRDQALLRAHKKPIEGAQNMARSFGLGRPTGIDLPTDLRGLIEDRAQKLKDWNNYVRKNACAGAKRRPKGSYLQRLDQENCTDGWVLREGDQANFDIGQGTVLVTPLQLAVAYEALVNGGRLVSPRLGKAIVTPAGKLVRAIGCPVVGHLPVPQSTLNDIMAAMYDVPRAAKGTASGAFAGFPFGTIKVGGKTGTADVAHKQPTSWFASFGGPAGTETAVRRRHDGHAGRSGRRGRGAGGARRMGRHLRSRTSPSSTQGRCATEDVACHRTGRHGAPTRHEADAHAPGAATGAASLAEREPGRAGTRTIPNRTVHVTDWTARHGAFGPETQGVRGWVAERESMLRRLDWPLMLGVLCLSSIGAVLVWSATKQSQLGHGHDPQFFLKRHIINLTIGLLLGALTAAIDYRSLRAYAPIVYGASVLGLFVVLSPFGHTINGAHSWIVLPAGFQIQPSEFAKVAIVVGMAMLLGEKRDGEDSPRDGDVVLVLMLVAVPILLIMLQPDLGTVMVIVFIVLGVLAVSGAPTRWVVGLVIAGAVIGFAGIKFGLLHHYQVARFTSFVTPGAHAQSTAYNQHNATLAIGSGGWLGKGLFHGTQTTGQFVPEQQTDFIFSVAGEELGLAGAGTIVLLVGLVLWRGLRIANRAGDLFGRLVATGVVCWFAFQAFENIGMTLGIMPVTGLPLPFVSYGGSSMFANLIAIGLLQNVHLRRET